ncbi:DinB family protein [Streptomyces zingiberis]|uniref:DinB family protein n=1 Tax=Streptomyces zingiberis TaxID=2053010 RepID=A0ABX1BQY1_9ACTN|nr:DinB family protein [Streptomyces zingiberis]NJQ00141.1 DinB family protein [Streptomyces zingiberis]
MTEATMKADLHHYLRSARGALLWKLDGLSEYDVRRPLTPTGTNLLGLVKHLAAVELGYFGDSFGRPFFAEGKAPVWYGEGAEDNADMWATADESREEIIELYHQAWQHADTTIESQPLDAVGRVPWWPEERRETSLHRLLVHVLAETNRHVGHADIVREFIDGSAGLLDGKENLPPGDRSYWEGYRERLERVAREAGGR